MLKKLFTVLVFGTLAILFYFVLQVRTVSVQNNNSCLPENLAEELQIKGKNIFLITQNELKNPLEEKYNCAQLKNVSKKYPSTIQIILEENVIVAQISNTNLAITQNGHVVGATDGKNIPKLDLEKAQEFKIGDTISDPGIFQASQIARYISKSDFNAQSIRLVGSQIVAYANDDLIVIFSANKSAQEQVDSLQQVLARAKINESKIGKIDLRFSKPVIEYQ